MKTCIIKHTVLFIPFFILIFACKKDKKVTPPDVYIGGTYTLKDGVSTSACYWKNGEFFPVKDSSKASNAYDMKVLNGSVYLVGQYNDQPCYWKDGVLHYLPNPNNFVFKPGSKATGMALFRGAGLNDITPIPTFIGQISYVSHLNFIATIWQPEGGDVQAKYNTYTFSDVSFNYQLAGMLVAPDTKLYIVGDHASGKPGYWLAEYPPLNLNYQITWHNLDNSSGSTYGLDLVQNDVYILGNVQNQEVYWKNGQLQNFAYLTGQNFSINKFRVNADGKIFLAGDDNSSATSKACVFVNGIKTILSTDPSNATNLTFYYNDVYVSGILSDKACYWQGATLIDLNRPKSAAKFIEIVSK